MKCRMKMLLIAGLFMAVAGLVRCYGAEGAAQGGTEVLKWKDGKKAVFFMAFDDSCVSQIKNAIPELKKRGFTGTFYINPGKGPFISQKDKWEKEIPAMGMEYGNHTFTHSGAANAAEFEKELQQSNDEINKCFPDRKLPRLIGYGRPGGIPKEKWGVTDQEVKQALAKHNLVERPSFYGPPIHQKTTADVLKVVDNAIAKGDMGHLDFHGVGGDWLATPMDQFIALMDKLAACREQLWVTDMISWHKYMTERTSAEVKTLESGNRQIRLQLTCKADPVLYDMPLTLATKVPMDWKQCQVTQGKTSANVMAVNGAIQYQAISGAGEILVKPVAASK
jgi:peptidoglycan/xylan/chitin deacetylase (PgdA/CDA1 family)